MKPIAFFDPIGHQGHASPGHPERPERLEAVKRALQQTGHWGLGPKLAPSDLPQGLLAQVHDPVMLAKLKERSTQGLDYDFQTYLTKKSWKLALQAAGGAVAVAGAVWRREAACGFALTRPPGHHSTRDEAMGFCLLNNIAIAAEYLLRHEEAKKVAIVDMDVHHGNGTQDIFWERDGVFFTSIHQSPLYPGTGHISEKGRGKGEGFTLNIPLPPYSGDEAYEVAFSEVILPRLESFEPEMLLVSYGFDAHWRDPLANIQLSGEGFWRQVNRLRHFAESHCGGRIALLLEGGYDLDAAANCGLAATQALLDEPFADELGASPYPESESWWNALTQVKASWDLA